MPPNQSGDPKELEDPKVLVTSSRPPGAFEKESCGFIRKTSLEGLMCILYAAYCTYQMSMLYEGIPSALIHLEI